MDRFLESRRFPVHVNADTAGRCSGMLNGLLNGCERLSKRKVVQVGGERNHPLSVVTVYLARDLGSRDRCDITQVGLRVTRLHQRN